MTEQQIIRCLRHEADTDEIREVEQWIAQSDDNRRVAMNLYRTYRDMEALHYTSLIDCDKAKQRLHERIGVAATKCRLALRPQLALASIVGFVSVVLAVGISYISYNRSTPQQMIELYAETGTTRSATLPDGSQVWLNANSTLRYPTEFSRRNREVELDGEAYFKVTKSDGRKFTVTTADIQVEVLGTEFDVDSYNIAGRTSAVTLVSGKVRMSYTDEDKLRSSIILKPNQRAELDATKQLRLFNTPTAKSAGLWTENKIVFDHTSFATAVRMIENRYNVSVNVKNPRLYDYTFSGTFTDTDLQSVLKYLSLASDIHFDCSAPDEATNQRTRRVITAE